MNTEIRFKTLKELYDRVKPALTSKAIEIHKNGYSYIHEEDIWNYLKNYKWVNSKDLDLGNIVNDIFLVDINELATYVNATIKDYHRNLDEDEN